MSIPAPKGAGKGELPLSQKVMERDYLWMPIYPGGEKRTVEIYDAGKKTLELAIPCAVRPESSAAGERPFFACLPVAAYRGRTLTFEGAPSGWVASLRCDPAPPPPPACPRPLLHFTPPTGWINDPNGLVLADGIYHLYYQYNPCDVEWGNMTWGHAHSRDMFQWEWDDPVLYPDETGTMFSGCAFRDDRNAAGFGRGRLLYYYTAAGGTNAWSDGRPYVQYLALGASGGMRLEKTGRVMIPAIAEGNRDPKVFYHEASGAYILVLYLSGNEFALFRSSDLLHWKESQRLALDGAWECPDLLELPVDGGGKQWVFWSADGYYFTGEFDGFRFTPTGPRRCAYAGGEPNAGGGPLRPGVTLLPYAAQTVAGMEDGRTISIAWLRTTNPPRISDPPRTSSSSGYGTARLPYTGMMALPVELSLTEDRRIRLTPVRELDALRGRRTLLTRGAAVEMKTAFELTLTLKNGSAEAELPAGRLEADGRSGRCRFTSALSTREFSYAGAADSAEGLSLRLIADTGIVEIFAQDGTIAMACETAPVLSGRVRCRINGTGEAFAAPYSLCDFSSRK